MVGLVQDGDGHFVEVDQALPHDVGIGAWDPQGRPSEMRLDRLLLVDPAAVQRKGS